MDLKLNIDNVKEKDYKKICAMLKQHINNSTITADIYANELKSIVVNYIKDKLDIDINKLSFDLQVDIDEDNLDISFILPDDDDLVEFDIFKKEMKHSMGNHIIRGNKINTKVLLRTIFINALSYKVHDSRLIVEYLSDGIEELNSIQVEI